MKLRDLIPQQDIVSVQGDADTEVTEIVFDTEQVREGCCFVCLQGKQADGHAYADLAVSAGATSVVTMQPYAHPYATVVQVRDTRCTLARMAANRYGNPADKLRIFGVVGTNGKSTVAWLLQHILETAGRKTGLLGTICYRYGDVRQEAELTTPDPLRLHALLADMVASGVQDVVMEVSAHAIALRKMCGIRLECGIFTNFSQDHLDYFETMEAYRSCKIGYFRPENMKIAVCNADDDAGRELWEHADVEQKVSYGLDNPSDVFAVDVRQTDEGAHFVVNQYDEIYEVRSNLYGRYNVSNMLAAAAAAGVCGISAETVCRALNTAQPPSGRFNVIRSGGVKYVIDFAHTPDGLFQLLKEARGLTRGKLITVFGCGGDRDVSKRPLMGKIAGELSDVVIVTSDNPRTESRQAIAADIVSGIRLKGKLYVELDRPKAIELAARLAQAGDTVLLAGKGCETYIEENNTKIPYSDLAQVLRVVGRCV